MVEHSPDLNPSLDEIESLAAVAASFWLDEADNAADENLDDDKRAPAAMAGFQIAAALHYLAERNVDAAERIADALRDVASAIRESRQATKGDAP